MVLCYATTPYVPLARALKEPLLNLTYTIIFTVLTMQKINFNFFPSKPHNQFQLNHLSQSLKLVLTCLVYNLKLAIFCFRQSHSDGKCQQCHSWPLITLAQGSFVVFTLSLQNLGFQLTIEKLIHF